MCGLYGFVRGGGPPQADVLRHVAGLAGTRGPHAHGQAARGARHVAAGPLDAARLSVPQGGSLIGHARMATAGRHDDLSCAQPLQAGPLFLAHNGTVPGHRDHARRAGLTLQTDSDSEVLALLLAREATLIGAAEVLEQLTPGLPLALLALYPDGRVLAARRGHPLYALRAAEGTYLCSLPFGAAQPLPDASLVEFTPGGAEAVAALPSRASLRGNRGGPAWTP